MYKCFSLFLMLLAINFAKAQTIKGSYDLCEGSLNVFKSGNYQLLFKGDKKASKTFDQYPAMSGITSSNQIWISFVAAERGTVSFAAKSNKTSLKFVVFAPTNKDVCTDLNTGLAEVKRFEVTNELTTTGLSKEMSKGFLYPINLEEGEGIYIVIIGSPESIEMVDFAFDFKSDNQDLIVESKVLDFRSDEFSPHLKITVRNAETGNPVIANTAFDGGKELNGLYKGSDFYFNISRSTKLNFKCEAEGYFFLDSTDVRIFSTKSQELVLKLMPVSAGKKLKLQDIDFFPGTSDITPESEARLTRLRDFLALNSSLNIEIGGHVFEPGTENSHAGQKMSEARAKRVMKYLIENGIDKSRLTSVGYGNTKPIYPEPVHIYEEQANRRVEIIVK